MAWKQEYKAFNRQELINIAQARYGEVFRINIMTDDEIRNELMEYDRIVEINLDTRNYFNKC